MKLGYPVWTALCLCASVPLVVLLLHRRVAGAAVPVVRVATFNASLVREHEGDLLAELRGGRCAPAQQVAEIVQRCAVDVLLLCELDRDAAGATATVFAREYLGVGQHGQQPIDFSYVFAAPVNTGEPSGLDLDRDGATGMAVLSRHPLDLERVRTFRLLKWSAMPDARRPRGCWPDDVWRQLRLSSKSHWDVPVHVLGTEVHLLCSHPTPPVFDGPEDRNGSRNHDEIRFWVDYLTPAQAGWIVDDQGVAGGLPDGAHFVVVGDQNCDPVDGDGQHDALLALLAHPRVLDPLPKSKGGVEQSKQQWGANAGQHGDPALDTGDFDDTPGRGPGNLRVDYVLPSRTLRVVEAAVFWPQSWEPGHDLVAVSDHRLVWVDLTLPANAN